MRLLIMSCAARKNEDSVLMPAIERYNSPAFYVVRKWIRETHDSQTTKIWILSAQYGLLTSKTLVQSYDLILTPARAKEMQYRINYQAEMFHYYTFNFFPPNEVFCFLPKNYLLTMQRYLYRYPNKVIATGPPGVKLQMLKDWLNSGVHSKKTYFFFNREAING